MVNLSGKDPVYPDLKCLKCGNAEKFMEFALTPTAQEFTLKSDKTDFSEKTHFVDDTIYVQRVRCGKCGALVWGEEEE